MPVPPAAAMVSSWAGLTPKGRAKPTIKVLTLAAEVFKLLAWVVTSARFCVTLAEAAPAWVTDGKPSVNNIKKFLLHEFGIAGTGPPWPAVRATLLK